MVFVEASLEFDLQEDNGYWFYGQVVSLKDKCCSYCSLISLPLYVVLGSVFHTHISSFYIREDREGVIYHFVCLVF